MFSAEQRMKFAKVAIGNTMPLGYYEGLHDRVITMPESNGLKENCAGYQVITLALLLLNTVFVDLLDYYITLSNARQCYLSMEKLKMVNVHSLCLSSLLSFN